MDKIEAEAIAEAERLPKTVIAKLDAIIAKQLEIEKMLAEIMAKVCTSVRL